ncbi:MAG: hypothetical protein ACI8ZN_000220 [Bacteroidia bacterium]|jgi:hypothetical protein
MLQAVPTKKGRGVEIWGSVEDLQHLYDLILKIWGSEDETQEELNRGKLISSFSYEVRKTAMEAREVKVENGKIFVGFISSWIHIIFSLSILRFCSRKVMLDISEQHTLSSIEDLIKTAMVDYDAKVGKELTLYIESRLDASNPYIYQYMRLINVKFMELMGGKSSFRQIPELLKTGCFGTWEYDFYLKNLQRDAKRMHCNINDLDCDDDHIDYENLKW